MLRAMLGGLVGWELAFTKHVASMELRLLTVPKGCPAIE
jgi:hypothetical protein